MLNAEAIAAELDATICGAWREYQRRRKVARTHHSAAVRELYRQCVAQEAHTLRILFDVRRAGRSA